jgi:hypothetical protein
MICSSLKRLFIVCSFCPVLRAVMYSRLYAKLD